MKNFALQKKPLRKKKDKPYTWREYLQIMYLIKDLYPDQAKIFRRQLKNMQTTLVDISPEKKYEWLNIVTH